MLNQYKIINNLRSGNYGKIYKVTYNNSLYVIKEDSNIELLQHEASIYKILRDVQFVSKLYDFFLKDNLAYMVIDHFDENLYLYKHKNLNNTNYEVNIIDIFTIIINTIHEIHNLGYVHRDLKPLNICLKNGMPYIIDFGFTKQIIINKKHNVEKNIKSIIGSYSFISNNVKNNIEPSRRDDIESIMYILLFMFVLKNKENNFVGFNINYEEIDELIIKLNKLNIESYKKILIYVKKMKFSQEPNYNYIIKELFV
jgi:serine/threonine protein kinase